MSGSGASGILFEEEDQSPSIGRSSSDAQLKVDSDIDDYSDIEPASIMSVEEQISDRRVEMPGSSMDESPWFESRL